MLYEKTDIFSEERLLKDKTCYFRKRKSQISLKQKHRFKREKNCDCLKTIMLHISKFPTTYGFYEVFIKFAISMLVFKFNLKSHKYSYPFWFFKCFVCLLSGVYRHPEKTSDLSQVTDKLYHILLYTSPWSKFELTSVVIGTDCTGSCKSNYHELTATTPSPPKKKIEMQMLLNKMNFIRKKYIFVWFQLWI